MLNWEGSATLPAPLGLLPSKHAVGTGRDATPFATERPVAPVAVGGEALALSQQGPVQPQHLGPPGRRHLAKPRPGLPERALSRPRRSLRAGAARRDGELRCGSAESPERGSAWRRRDRGSSGGSARPARLLPMRQAPSGHPRRPSGGSKDEGKGKQVSGASGALGPALLLAGVERRSGCPFAAAAAAIRNLAGLTLPSKYVSDTCL